MAIFGARAAVVEVRVPEINQPNLAVRVANEVAWGKVAVGNVASVEPLHERPDRLSGAASDGR